MLNRITKSKAPITTEELANLETRLSFEFPEEYRKFLLVHNGGRPDHPCFLFKRKQSDDSDSLVNCFFSINGSEYTDFETLFRIFKVDGIRVPAELVPIADDPFGNLICIAVAGPKRGAVYFWDHDTEAEDGESPTYYNVDLIANSFNAFLECLHELPQSED